MVGEIICKIHVVLYKSILILSIFTVRWPFVVPIGRYATISSISAFHLYVVSVEA